MSRSYALPSAPPNRGWHLEADTRSQVYRGGARHGPRGRPRHALRVLTTAASRSSPPSTRPRADAPRAPTWGRDLAYLVSLEVDDEDDSPDTYWRAGITRTTLGRALAAAGWPIGEIREAEVVERSESGRVAGLRFRGSRGEVRLSGRQRGALGESTLKSTLFELRDGGDGFVFVGSGSGHGVGMSQWGARGLAERGEDYRSILETSIRARCWCAGARRAGGAGRGTVNGAPGRRWDGRERSTRWRFDRGPDDDGVPSTILLQAGGAVRPD